MGSPVGPGGSAGPLLERASLEPAPCDEYHLVS
jgi:hypothetical protein